MAFRLRLVFIGLLLLVPVGGLAQSSFAPAIRVNDEAVSVYELQQRQRFLSLLGAPPEVVADAGERLIDERLQLQEARRLGIEVSEERIAQGQEQFVSQGNLSREEFIAVLGQAGVSPETFRDFVRSGLAFREVIRREFGPSVEVAVTDIDVDRELRQSGRQPGVRVEVAEILLPAGDPVSRQRALERVAEIRRLPTREAFAAAARRLSQAPSRTEGGRLDPIPIEALPPGVGERIADLAPGQISGPIELPDVIAVYQLLDQEVVGGPEERAVLDYAVIRLDGRSSGAAARTAANYSARADTCDDLYGVARGTTVARQSSAPTSVPDEIRATLARLDAGETATLDGPGDALTFVMLCNRGVGQDEGEAARGALREQIVNRRLTRQAQAFLAELRAEADIERLL